jgi:hypothetical protein
MYNDLELARATLVACIEPGDSTPFSPTPDKVVRNNDDTPEIGAADIFSMNVHDIET